MEAPGWNDRCRETNMTLAGMRDIILAKMTAIPLPATFTLKSQPHTWGPRRSPLCPCGTVLHYYYFMDIFSHAPLMSPGFISVVIFCFHSKFRLSYYPHRLESFTGLLHEAFGGQCEHMVYGDFLPFTQGQETDPCYFIHVTKRTA